MTVIYTAYITRDGKRIYASQYGLKAFRFEVDDDEPENLENRPDDSDKELN